MPDALEHNVANLIDAGVLDSIWGPFGVTSYQERLALFGRALFEMVWRPEDGGTQRNTTGCAACHSQPPSAWSGGSAELLRQQLIGAGAVSCASTAPPLPITATGNGCTTFAHGTVGSIAWRRNSSPNRRSLAAAKAAHCVPATATSVSLAQAVACATRRQ